MHRHRFGRSDNCARKLSRAASAKQNNIFRVLSRPRPRHPCFVSSKTARNIFKNELGGGATCTWGPTSSHAALCRCVASCSLKWHACADATVLNNRGLGRMLQYKCKTCLCGSLLVASHGCKAVQRCFLVHLPGTLQRCHHARRKPQGRA